MRRKPRPPKPALRQPWQIEQAARCGCKGTDDMCPCQNENPWPRARTREQELETRVRELEGHVSTLELQQQTDRQTIASLTTARDWSDHEDAIADAIQDSLDMDWTSRDGARAVVRCLAALAAPPPTDEPSNSSGSPS